MTNLEDMMGEEVLNEEKYFMKSYDRYMYLFGNNNADKDPKMTMVDKEHAVIRLTSNKGIFYHKLYQSPIILIDVTEATHYVVVYHHNDMDGYVSAATTAYSLYNPPQKFIEYNFGDIKPIIDTTENALVNKTKEQKTLAIIVDLSLPWDADKPGLLSFICQRFDQVIWIDHHGTSLEVADKLIEYNGYPHLSMFIDVRMSSAMQCKCLFRPISNSMINQIVSYYDRKDDKRHPNVYQLGVYLNQYIHDFNIYDPSNPFYTYIALNVSLSKVLAIGETLCSIKNIKDKIMYDADIKYSCNMFGLYIIGLNRSGNSMIFTDPIPTDSIKVIFRKLPDGKLLFSVYSDSPKVKKMNLGVVMREEFGGGGHPGAAGATIEFKELEARADEYGYNIDEVSNYTDMIGPELRYNGELKTSFINFCSVLMERWKKFTDSEE